MGKLNYEVKEGVLHMGADSNEDGENSISLKLHLNEAIQEAFKKGEAVEGVKVVGFKFELTKLKLQLDTDKDGENLLELEIDLAESFDEIQDLIAKRNEPTEDSPAE